MKSTLPLLCSLLALNACAGLFVSAATEAGVSSAENRSIGRKVDDKVIYGDIWNQYVKGEHGELVKYVNLNTRFGRVMLTGTVPSEEVAQQAVALAWKADGVQEVINELQIGDASLLDTAGDSLVKRNVEGRLLITKGVWVINYSIDVQNGVAYIIGQVKDDAELNRVLNVLRTTRGVKRVVSHLKINAEGASEGWFNSQGNANGSDANGHGAPASDKATASPGAAAPAASVTPPASAPVEGPVTAGTRAVPNAPVSQESARPVNGGF